MKSFKLFIGSVIAIVCLVVSGGVFTSCTNDDDQLLAGDSQTEQLSSNSMYNVTEMINFLSDNYGFKRSKIEQQDSALVVEGDMIFDINDFWEKYSSTSNTTRTHYRFIKKVSSSHYNILVKTPPSSDQYALPLNWLTGVVRAVSAWNATGGPIHFTLWSGDTYSDTILVRYVGFYNQPSTIAQASFPSDGEPGHGITINANQQYALTRDTCSTTQIMIHELGHNLGFAHTDQTPSDNTIYSLNTSDLDSTDSTSVMWPYALSSPQYPYFTSCDLQAYRLLYNW